MAQISNCTAPTSFRPYGHALICILFSIALTSIAFLVEPRIDITFSALFFDGIGFAYAQHPVLQKLRALNDWLGGLVLASSMALLFSAPLRRRLAVSRRDALIPILTYGLGAGLLVNVTFKETFGRARPRDVIEFGGDQVFTRVWEISGACSSNCSFTSGEAAGAAALFSVMFIIPRWAAGLRMIVAAALAILVAALSLNRIAFGGHFLSDVVLSVLTVLGVMLASRIVLHLTASTAHRHSYRSADAAEIEHLVSSRHQPWPRCTVARQVA